MKQKEMRRMIPMNVQFFAEGDGGGAGMMAVTAVDPAKGTAEQGAVSSRRSMIS